MRRDPRTWIVFGSSLAFYGVVAALGWRVPPMLPDASPPIDHDWSEPSTIASCEDDDCLAAVAPRTHRAVRR